MYHCHVQFYLIGCQKNISDIIKQQPPLANFTHSFAESDVVEPELASQADVILAEMSNLDMEQTLSKLDENMKKGASLILLLNTEQMSCLPENMPENCDIWTMPLGDRGLRFHFQRWQQTYKQGKDLWESNQFLEAVINSSPNLIWYKTREGIHEKVNDSFCKVVNKSKSQVEGSTHAYIWDVAEDDPACIASEEEVMESQKTCLSDEVIQTGDGSRLLTTYKSPLFNWDGSVMGTVGVAIDVTRERAYEQEIIKKNSTLEMLFSTMDCGVMCHSLDGKKVISVNRAALELLDYTSQDEMLEDGFDLVAHSVMDEDKPKLRECITSLKQVGESANIEYRILHKDGRLCHVLGNIKLVEENGELFYQRFLLDCTAQKLEDAKKMAQKDQEIRYQEQLFEIFSKFLSDNVDDVYMMFNETGEKAEFVSNNIERVLGVSWQSVMESLENLGQANYITGEELGIEKLQALEPGMALDSMETERINPQTGEHKWFRESVNCVSVDGKKKIIIYISDRTKERNVQNTLTEALNMAQVANKAKSTFLSNVSHDIRTPMNAIMGFITLLREDVGDAERVNEYTQKISAASQHLLGLINDVLDMNKIESGSVVLNISELNLAEIIDELNAIIRPQARAKQQTFDIRVSSLTCENLLGDKLRINQILINILSNAVKYTQVGGEIKMQVDELPRVDKNYSRIRFAISDNGQGMSEAYQRVIFDPFTREQDTTLNQIQGTGLGMAITKNLVDLMDGTIKVDSALGKGSTFTVELELRIQEKVDDPKFWGYHGIARMIVADDDEDICRDIMHKMAKTGVNTEYVTNGHQAVEMIRSAREKGEPYDLILLDWKMPDLNGLETAKLIRKNYPDKIPILLFTAYDWVDIEQEALGVGIEHFLPKPFFMSNFKDTIQRMKGTEATTHFAKSAGSVVAGKRVLVVDDIEVNRIVMVKILSTLGAQCDVAIDGQEAVNMFEASQPGDYDLILMDIQMPMMDGYTATRTIRSGNHPLAKTVPIIAMTANAFVEDVRSAIEAGMDAHIAKPIQLDKLQATIQQVFDSRQEG